MQGKIADSGNESGTQVQRYTAAELALLDRLAPRQGVTKTELAELFPGRTLAAVKKQLVAARHRLGLIEPVEQKRGDCGYTMLSPDDPGDDDGWWQRYTIDQKQGSDALLAALMAA